jgi:hypothetical protein
MISFFFPKLIFLLKWKNIKTGLANLKELNVCYSNPRALRILTNVGYFILFFFFLKIAHRACCLISPKLEASHDLNCTCTEFYMKCECSLAQKNKLNNE